MRHGLNAYAEMLRRMSTAALQHKRALIDAELATRVQPAANLADETAARDRRFAEHTRRMDERVRVRGEERSLSEFIAK